MEEKVIVPERINSVLCSNLMSLLQLNQNNKFLFCLSLNFNWAAFAFVLNASN